MSLKKQLLLEIAASLLRLERKIEMTSAENKAELSALATSTGASLTGIAADIQALTERLNTGMTQADVDALKAELTAIATRASGIDALNPPTA